MKKSNNLYVAVIIVLCVIISSVLALVFSDRNYAEENDDFTVVISAKNDKPDEKKQKLYDAFSAIECCPTIELSSLNETQKPEYKSVSFVAVGDNIIHSTVLSDASDKAAGTEKEYNFINMFDNIASHIESADFAFINQEAPIAGRSRGYTGYPMFNAPEQVVFDLSEIGFDIFNIANNHMLDRQTSGYKSTVEFFKNNNFTYIGGFTDKDDYENIKIVEKDGIKIALLSYTYGTNGLTLDRSCGMVIPLCDSYSNDELDRQSKIARELADIVVVSMHWGAEHWSDNFEPISLQKKQADILINNNVDVIIGSHPHALEPMMWRDRPDGGKTLVIYSLGNILSGMEYMRNHVGGIAGFEFVKLGNKTYVQAPYFIPTVCHFDSRVRNFKIYKLSEYTEELLVKHGTQVRGTDTRRSIQYLESIVEATIPDEFLIESYYNSEDYH